MGIAAADFSMTGTSRLGSLLEPIAADLHRFDERGRRCVGASYSVDCELRLQYQSRHEDADQISAREALSCLFGRRLGAFSLLAGHGAHEVYRGDAPGYRFGR